MRILFSDYRLYCSFSDCIGNIRKSQKEIKRRRPTISLTQLTTGKGRITFMRSRRWVKRGKVGEESEAEEETMKANG